MESVSKQIAFEVLGVSRKDLDIVSNREFSEFGVKEVVQEDKTVEQFFQDYSDLFYKIPAEGDINSHKFLIERSSQLVKVEQVFEDIQPLLDEIANLKNQALQDRQTIVELNNQIAELKNATNS